MAGAPVLNGTVGSLIAVLDACLINGFGLKSATSLVVAGGVATLTFSGGASAALVDSVIEVIGATPAALNGAQKVLTANDTTVTFATDEVDGTATGTITFKLAAGGWLKSFTGTNLAAYKSADPESTGCLFRVDDTGTTSARVVGYESMSAISTGTGPFPTDTQLAGGGYWTKSSAANATANTWILICDSRYFIFWAAPASGASATSTQGPTRGFGDFIAHRPSGDAFACSLNYSITATVGNQHDGGLDYSGNIAQHALPRSYTGLGGALLGYCTAYTGSTTSVSGADTTLGDFPSPIDGSLRLSKRHFKEGATSSPRGDVPGLYHCPQGQTSTLFPSGNYVSGSGQLAGRQLISLKAAGANFTAAATNINSGASFVDITGPWR